MSQQQTQSVQGGCGCFGCLAFVVVGAILTGHLIVSWATGTLLVFWR